jgi:Excalibur calcium-binding domain
VRRLLKPARRRPIVPRNPSAEKEGKTMGFPICADGRRGARDHTSGTPVTNFERSNRLYRQNSHLDRDKDGIACEKR